MTPEIFREVNDDYEVIDGEKFLWHSENLGHNLIRGNLIMLFGAHIKINRSGFIVSQLYTYLPDGNLVFPDIIFIDRAQEKLVINNPDDGFHGVPDMVAEIFSRSTMKRDIGIKKDVYERNGVREYWMIDPWSESIRVYLLRDGKYFLDEIYHNYPEDELKELTDEERAEIKFEIPVAVLDGFKVKIKNIFGRYIEP
ncbi:MAG: Uma2 family endonuclease [Selenomonadaceae bacterium]|nr:Uma2 family endonuclease [Selenomonadaceae bacterium]MBQ9497501.1 Uma2 family endonuclease [Selenomonadaceae bacterium]